MTRYRVERIGFSIDDDWGLYDSETGKSVHLPDRRTGLAMVAALDLLEVTLDGFNRFSTMGYELPEVFAREMEGWVARARAAITKAEEGDS
jgi:hypothetical protein